MQFSTPIADAKNFPVADIFVSPKVPDSGELNLRESRLSPHVVLPTNRARTALYIVAKAINTTRVWIPAYHCPALVEPFLAAGIEVKFYAMNEDLTPAFESFLDEVDAKDAVVGIHYFGFSCGNRELAEGVKQKGAIFIEDKAHAALDCDMLGELAVTSLVKFYPVSEGAELIIRQGSTWLEALQQRHAQLPDLTTRKVRKLWRKIVTKLSAILGKVTQPKLFRYFKPEEFCHQLPHQDEVLLTHSDHQRIASKRRDNFEYLSQQLSHVTVGKPLFKQLDDNAIPYVFPFLLHDSRGFDYIRKQGIQIFRWEELAETDCKVSAAYRARLIQLPVHQDLTKEQLDKMIRIIHQAGEPT